MVAAPGIPVLRRQKFKVILSYMVRLKPAWATGKEKVLFAWTDGERRRMQGQTIFPEEQVL